MRGLNRRIIVLTVVDYLKFSMGCTRRKLGLSCDVFHISGLVHTLHTLHTSPNWTENLRLDMNAALAADETNSLICKIYQ